MNDSLVSALVVLLLVVSVAALAVALVALRRTTVDARRISRRNPISASPTRESSTCPSQSIEKQ